LWRPLFGWEKRSREKGEKKDREKITQRKAGEQLSPGN
jgi:hypothetical protein